MQPHIHKRWSGPRVLVALALSLVACAQQSCPGGTDGGSGVACRLDRDCGASQLCRDGACVEKQVCHSDAECQTIQRCDALSGSCVLRLGFATECGPNNDNRHCEVGQFCALGRCRDSSNAIQCTRRFQCPVGQVCDRESFYCIEEASCTLATDPVAPYPELACDPGNVCDPSGVCIPPQQPCTPGNPSACQANELCNAQGHCVQCILDADCASGELCSATGQCVQCISNQDCGVGLRCNTRAGLCESENTCRSDAQCNAPLVCDRTTALCAVPQPPCQSDLHCQLGEYCDLVLGTCQPKGGKCVDDRLEDSDTPLAARQVDLGNALAGFADLQLCPNDPDVFGLDLAQGDEVRAELLNVAANARAEISALAPGGLETMRFAEAPPRGTGSVSFVAQTAGRYFVRVISLTGQSRYGIRFTRTLGQACGADIYEPASNAPASAPDLAMGFVSSLTLCPSDEDWYRIKTQTSGLSVRAGDSIEVRLDGPTDQDFDLLLTNRAGTTILASAEGPTSDEVLRYRFAQAQDALIHVTPYGNSSGPYTLQLSVTGAFMCLPDALEGDIPDGGAWDAGAGNNNAAQATPVGLEGYAADLTLCLADEDWFAVEARAHQRVLATATWPAGESGVRLDAMDGAGHALGQGSGTGLAALSVPGNDQALVLVRVSNPGATSPYHLAIQVQRLTDCSPDDAEPNNTPAQAPPLPADGLFTLCGTDADLFRVTAEAGKRLRASVDFSTADGDVDLAFLLPDGITPYRVSDGVTGHEELDVVIPANTADGGAASYYLLVYAARSDTRAPYHLSSQILAQ